LVARALATPRPAQFTLRDVSERPFRFTRPLNSVASDFGPCVAADFTDLDRPGLYQITVGNEHAQAVTSAKREAASKVADLLWRV
jgi:hypothetical protein